MFDWNDLRHFLAVARAGSTLGAAKRLGVNQTTVARRLDALEGLPPVAWLREAAGGAGPLRCSTINNIVNAAAAGLGLAALPSGLGDRHPDLVWCQPVTTEGQASFWVLTRQDLKQVPRIRAFIDFIVPHLAASMRQTPDRSGRDRW